MLKVISAVIFDFGGVITLTQSEAFANFYVANEDTISGDRDFDDFVVSGHLVPEPISMLIFGLALLGIGARMRRC